MALIKDKFDAWEKEAQARFDKLKSNEEELNKIFINLYGLQDELDYHVKDESIFGVEYPAELNRLLLLKCKSIGADPISFHGLRHTHCSLLLRDGIPIISVSKRLGHSDTTVTQKIYTHLMAEQEEEDNVSIIRLLETI